MPALPSFETPARPTSTPTMPEIISMPSSFRGGGGVLHVSVEPAVSLAAGVSSGMSLPPVPPAEKISRPSVMPPPTAVPVPAPPSSSVPSKMAPVETVGFFVVHRKMVIVGAVMAVVILSLTIGAWWYIRSLKQAPAVVPARTVPVTAPVVPDPVPQLPPPTPITTQLFPVLLNAGLDTDQDALTDTEETLIYLTDPAKPDTDQDGFLDGNEVFHRYDPKASFGTLIDSGVFLPLRIQLPARSLTFAVPQVWRVDVEANALQEQAPAYLVSSTTQETLRIRFFSRDASAPFEAWKSGLPEVAPLVLTPTPTRATYTLFLSPDQRTAFVDLNDTVIVFQYQAEGKPSMEYAQTFLQMIHGVESTPVVQTSNATVPVTPPVTTGVPVPDPAVAPSV